MGDIDERVLNKEVAGEYNTLKVYVFMLKAKHSSYKEVQRGLGFSSPTLAQHHLDKLTKLGMVVKNADGSFTVKPRSFGILRFYFRSGRWIVPRTIFFSLMFGTLALGFIVLSVPRHPEFYWVALAISLAGLTYSLYETIRFYSLLPK